MEKFLSDYGLKWVGLENMKQQKGGRLDIQAINKDIDNQKSLYIRDID